MDEAAREQRIIDAEVAMSAAALKQCPDLDHGHKPGRADEHSPHSCDQLIGYQQRLLDEQRQHLADRTRLLGHQERLLKEQRRYLAERERLLDEREQELAHREQAVDQREIDIELRHWDSP